MKFDRNTEMDDLGKIAVEQRRMLVRMSHQAKAPHLGSALSCVDILTVLYWKILRHDPDLPEDPLRDRLILSKGHAAAALYAALALRGYFPRELLRSYALPGVHLPEHPSPGCLPGIEAATGSLGHGLSIGLGMALGAKITKVPYRVFVLMSDGECNEGSVWEAAMMAPRHNLGNLVAIIDYNKWQATGRSDEVLDLHPLTDKWSAFGWQTAELDGHDIPGMLDGFSSIDETACKPTVVIAHTVKGKGVSFMEDDNNWHYRIPTRDELALAEK